MRRHLLALLVMFHASVAVAQYVVTASPSDAHRGDPVVVSFTRPAGVSTPVDVVTASVMFSPGNHRPKTVSFVSASPTVATFTFDVPEDVPLGTYGLAITDGKVVATNTPVLRVTMPGPPKITSIRPTEWFPGDEVNLQIYGENFSTVGGETRVEVGGERFQTPCSSAKATDCVQVHTQHALTLRGVPHKEAERKKIVVEVAGKRSAEDVSLLVSQVGRKWPAIMGIGAVLAVVSLVALLAMWKKGRTGFRSLLIDPVTESYSLSALQFYLWTAAAIFGYAFLTTARTLVQRHFELPDVPAGLPGILAISAGTGVIAAGAESDKTKGGGGHRASLSDLLTTGGMIVPERVQFLVWTLIGLTGFVALIWRSNPANIETLPSIPEGLLFLMGISSLGYLGGKIVRPPGPVIANITHAAGQFTITGRNLQAANVTVAGAQVRPVPADEEDRKGYYRTLTVPAPAAAPAANAPVPVVVTNTDGQKAEKTIP